MSFDVLDSSNVKKVIKMLRDSRDEREIEYKSTNELPFFTGKTSGAVRESPNLIEVFINNDSADYLQEDVIVHEILHIILNNEGYPQVEFDMRFYHAQNEGNRKMIDMALSVLRSNIQHPEIFRRQRELFNMDLASIFKHQINQKREKYSKKKPENAYHLACQQTILESIDFPHFPPPYDEEVLKLYHELQPGLYAESQEMYNRLEDVDMFSSEDCRQGAEIILAFIIEYGAKNGIDGPPSYQNHIWRKCRIQ